MLFVGFVVQRFAGLRVKFLSCPPAYRAIELDIWRIELWLSRFQHAVEAVNQPGYFVAVKMAVVIIEIIQLSTSTLNAPSRRLFSNARRSSIFCASTLPE